MKLLRGAAAGIWEFVVGDDWRLAVGVIAALGLTALVAEHSAAWFVLPAAVGFLLGLSVWLGARKAG
jgi:hypothetical protein